MPDYRNRRPVDAPRQTLLSVLAGSSLRAMASPVVIAIAVGASAFMAAVAYGAAW